MRCAANAVVNATRRPQGLNVASETRVKLEPSDAARLIRRPEGSVAFASHTLEPATYTHAPVASRTIRSRLVTVEGIERARTHVGGRGLMSGRGRANSRAGQPSPPQRLRFSTPAPASPL